MFEEYKCHLQITELQATLDSFFGSHWRTVFCFVNCVFLSGFNSLLTLFIFHRIELHVTLASGQFAFPLLSNIPATKWLTKKQHKVKGKKNIVEAGEEHQIFISHVTNDLIADVNSDYPSGLQGSLRRVYGYRQPTRSWLFIPIFCFTLFQVECRGINWSSCDEGC